MSVGASTQITGRILAINTITFGASSRLDALPPATSCGASNLAPDDVKTLEFTDLTLVAGIRGASYSDVVVARTLLSGIPDNQVVSYSISPSPGYLGLSLSSTGAVTGTVSSNAAVGIHLFTVSASSSGHVTQTYVYSVEVKAVTVVPLAADGPPEAGLPPEAAVPSVEAIPRAAMTGVVEFMDIDLLPGVRGQIYGDSVVAKTLLNGIPNKKVVTYSVSPSVAYLGLDFSAAGVLTGRVLATAPLGIHQFKVTASSIGHESQTYLHSFKVIDNSPTPVDSKFKTITLKVNFQMNSFWLSTVEKSKILKLVGKIAPKVSKGSIIGYVQQDGKPDAYSTLSASRARVIARYLYSIGVTAHLQTEGKGMLNATKAARMATVELTYTNRIYVR
jgi:hypothetical protein